MNLKFNKNLLFILVLFTSLLGALAIDFNLNYLWATLIFNGIFFTLISLGALFFISLSNIFSLSKENSLLVTAKHISLLIIPSFIILFTSFIFGSNAVYPWDKYENVPVFNIIYDFKYFYFSKNAILLKTFCYFLFWFYILRTVVYNKNNEYLHLRKVSIRAIIILISTITFASWDWIISIYENWFSSVWGWYIFTSGFLCSLSFIAIIYFIYNKQSDKQILKNSSILLSRFLFFIVIFWFYLWFSQFIIQWYNKTEADYWFYKIIFTGINKNFNYCLIFLNFIVPVLMLLSNKIRSNISIVFIVSLLIYIGNFINMYLLFFPFIKNGFNLHYLIINMLFNVLMIFTLTRLKSVN